MKKTVCRKPSLKVLTLNREDILKLEKVYITRDEESDQVWVWRKPAKGLWGPVNICKEIVNYQRENMSLDNTDSYLVLDFKKKFGIMVSEKTKEIIKLPVKKLNNEDYKLFSNDKNRK